MDTTDFRTQLQRTLGEGLTLERELEGGGMSRVFVARDQQLGRRVVVKTLGDAIGASLSAERFRREIRLAASLQQANIVPVHAAGEVDGVPYYTMPFVEGESLRAHLAASGALESGAAIHILRDVARALAFAHERGVVHRDIKPENILLSGSTAVVTDFGIAKAIEASHSRASDTTLTQLGTLIGTPMYMSPEQAAGDPNVDHRSDLYSLGVVAYEMLAGNRPFSSTTARELLVAHVLEAPPPLADQRKGIPARLSALVMRCLEKDPGRRPQNAVEFLTALDGALVAGAQAAPSMTPSIAVLPFANLSPDPADGFFADGLTDEIITDLSGIRALRVIARSAMMRYKGTDKEPGVIARELRVRYVLDGSVRRAGDSLRLTARLLDAETDTPVWSDKLSGGVEDVFAMQERVSRTIVDALRLTLSPREHRQLAARPIEDIKAYEAYLQAKQAIWSFSPRSLDRAGELLEGAQHRIGENALLIAARGMVHLHAISTGVSDVNAHVIAADACARQLAQVDPESFGRYLLGGVLHWCRGEMREAIVMLTTAHTLEPSNPDAIGYLQYACLMAGMDDRAREFAQLLVSLDPLTPLFQVMPAFCDLMAGRAAETLPAYRAYVASEVDSPLAHFWLMSIAAEAGDTGEMERVAAELLRRWPETPFGEVARHVADPMRREGGRVKVPDSISIREASAASESIARSLMWTWARLGAVDASLDALEDAMRRGFAHYPHLARSSRSLGALREHPRFRRLLEIVRQRWERGGTSAEDLAAPASHSTVATPAGSAPAAIAVLPSETARGLFRAGEASERRSVAILPFSNLSPDPENEFFADGITDDVIAQLAKVGALRVIARTSVMRYRGVPDAARTAARELGVGAVVEGTVRRAGKRARIVAQLVDTASDAPIWSETYDRDLDDVFFVQTDVATSVANALRATLTPDEKKRLADMRSVDATTYDLYLLGRYQYNRRTPDSLRAAITHFEKAIERDPRFVPAYAGLADTYLFAALGYAPIPSAEAFTRAKDFAARALALDPASPEALCAMALAAMHGDWDVPRARELYERAVRFNPNHATAHQFLAWCHFSVGDYVGALEPGRRALELDPLNVSIIAEAGWPYSYAGLHEIARERYRAAIEVDPGFGLAYYNLGMTWQHTGRIADAMECYERALSLMGRAPWVLASLAKAHIEAGDAAKAEILLDELREQARSGIAVWLSIAQVLDTLGRTDEVFGALDRSIVEHEPFVWAIGLENWMHFPNARRDPRFARVLDRLGVTAHDVARQRELLLAAHTSGTRAT